MSDPSYPDALPSQHRLHWYVLERVLGQGGFGITYLARDANLDQQVAIKEYLPVDVATRRADASVRSRTEDQGERYRWGLDRFIREARTLARFDHPNIVRVLSVFEHNNTAYMVMRFEEGENLAALLERRRTLPEDELMRIVLPILDGLELVHNAGFIHRDIKPDNIHIRADGSPVLLDFGSARHSMGHARTVTILVAPGYAPFEQYYSSGENQGPWTDLYSLGATCYRAISGISPMDAITRSKGILGSTQEILVPAATIGSGRYSASLLKAIDHALQFAEKEHRGVAAGAHRRTHARGASGAGNHVGDAGDGAAPLGCSPRADTGALDPRAGDLGDARGDCGRYRGCRRRALVDP
jgi:serine/threonine protein kinase